MKKTFFFSVKCILLSGLLCTATGSWAQSPGPGGPVPSDPPPTTDPTAVPIDGGASLLLAGGAAYGLRKLRQRRTNA